MWPGKLVIVFELDCTFRSFDEWLTWGKKNSYFGDAKHGYDLGQRVMQQGLVEPLTNLRAEPRDIEVDAAHNWRESLVAFGRNSRVRAVMSLIAEKLTGCDAAQVTIYATEGVTALAMCLRGLFPKFLGSEYASSEAVRDSMYPIPHEDLTKLTLRSNAFDLVTTNEVLEHVPSLDAGLAEIHRVLRPGGWHVGTHPFAFMDATGFLKAQLVDGEVKHLMEPEYHGNPVGSPSLVFELPGWDIVTRARAIGFSDAHMRFVASEKHGYLTENTGVFVFCCQK